MLSWLFFSHFAVYLKLNIFPGVFFTIMTSIDGDVKTQTNKQTNKQTNRVMAEVNSMFYLPAINFVDEIRA